MRVAASAVLALALVGVGHQTATAAPVIFFGEDLGLGESTRLLSTPNADAARDAFFASLSGVGTESFESFTVGDGTVIAEFGSVTATLTGGNVAYQGPGATNGVGRYPVSGTQYWQSSSSTTLTFSAPVAAFGFYGVDIGDFNGQVTLTTTAGSPLVLNVGNSLNTAGGGVLYFGFYVTDPNELFTSITFGNTAPGSDIFGFDDFSVGTLAQVAPVPEPASLVLLGGVLAGFAARRRARRA